MSILSDYSVKKLVNQKLLIIDPFLPKFLGPNLYYCHLGNKFLVVKKGVKKVDPLLTDSEEIFEQIEVNNSFVIPPRGFVLAETFEYLGINDQYVIKLMNSSSLARVGISQAAVGMVNAGCGMEKPVKITLELINNAPFDVVLKPTIVLDDGSVEWGTEVLKIAIQTMDSKPELPYDKWKFAVYHTDQKPSGPKMKNRFSTDDKYVLPESSLHRNGI